MPTERIVDLLGQHRLGLDVSTPREFTKHGNWNWSCSCGATMGDDEEQVDLLHRRHLAEVLRLAGYGPVAEIEAEIESVLEDRDEAHDWADRLAYALAGDAIGEHSAMNNPWANALRIAEEGE